MERMIPLAVLCLFTLNAQKPEFDYDSNAPIDLRAAATRDRGGVLVKDVTFAAVSGGRTGAYLVEPRGDGPFAAALYVHWYEPHAKDSNRTQFLNEAITLARRGVVSLLIDTMWSDVEWFKKRRRSEDFANSVRQVKELRRALDVLLSDRRIDRRRVAYIGHDFGAMYGAVLAGVESKRVSAWALQAGTTSFSDWYLLGPPKLQGDDRLRFIEELAPLDPARYIGSASPSPIFFQFAHEDFYVPKNKALQFFAAAREPKEIRWYGGGHGLNAQAIDDRVAWLTIQLSLKDQKRVRESSSSLAVP